MTQVYSPRYSPRDATGPLSLLAGLAAAALGRYRAAPRRSQCNAWLNGALYVLMVLTTFSGLMISRFVFPAVGMTASALRFWHPFHSVLASLTLAVVGLHSALNWDWIVGALRQWRTHRRLVSHRTLAQRLDLDGVGRVASRFARVFVVTLVVCALSLLLVSRSARRTMTEAQLTPVPHVDFGEVIRESSVQLLVIAVSALIGRTVLRFKL